MKPANKGRYYHDGRFLTLLDVVNHYNTHFSLGLTAQEKLDLVEYLKSLPRRNDDDLVATSHFAGTKAKKHSI